MDMKFKVLEITVSNDDPFALDALDRKKDVESVSKLIEKLPSPFVFAINSPWGTGKTTFVKMLKCDLERKKFPCIYFNAWETDFTTDPLVAFVGEIGELCKEKSGDSKWQGYYDKVKKSLPYIARGALPALGKIATVGVLDVEKVQEKILSDFVGQSISDAVGLYAKEKEMMIRFRDSLTKVMSAIVEGDNDKKVIVFVDELDRCRPTYAIELLERIKHLFNVKNVIFVLSLDKVQLQVSLGAVYGEGINSSEYLRRFVDLEYSLPEPDSKKFAEHLFSEFGFNSFFKGLDLGRVNHVKVELIDAFSDLSDFFELSMRTRERCFTRIRVAMLLSSNGKIYPYLLVFLIILNIKSPGVCNSYMSNDGDASNILNYLNGLHSGSDFLMSESGCKLEAYLVAGKCKRNFCRQKSYKSVVTNKLSQKEIDTKEYRDRDNCIESMVTGALSDGLNLKYIVSLLDLSAGYQS